MIAFAYLCTERSTKVWARHVQIPMNIVRLDPIGLPVNVKLAVQKEPPGPAVHCSTGEKRSHFPSDEWK